MGCLKTKSGEAQRSKKLFQIRKPYFLIQAVKQRERARLLSDTRKLVVYPFSSQSLTVKRRNK